MAEVLAASPHNNASHFASPQSSAIFLGPSAYPLGAKAGVASHELDAKKEEDDDDDDMYSTQSSSAPSSPQQSHSNLSRTSSFHSTPPSSISLNAYQSNLEDEDEDDFLPSYGDKPYPSKSMHRAGTEDSSVSVSDICSSATDEEEPSSPAFPHVADDTEAREEPSRQVDYLSHDWREEDIWSSWKHIVSRRKEYGERSRLENASWRTWAKSKNNLKTVSPERLNWLKDCDVTWLYGPLQQGSHGHERNGSEPASRLSKNNSFVSKKSNLKKRSVSEVMLQKSISSSSLVKQAAAAVQAQRRTSTGSRPLMSRGRSDYGPMSSNPIPPSDLSAVLTSSSSSGIHSPDTASRRHIRFDTKVEQCIAVDFKENADDSTESQESFENVISSASSSEDDLPMMKARNRSNTSRQISRTSSSRNSFSNAESKGIAMLPSTQIKFHADEAEQQQQQQQQAHQSPLTSAFGLPAAWRGSCLDKSPSQETLRPSKGSANFLLDEPDDGEGEIDWEPSGSSGTDRLRKDSMAAARRSDSSSELLSSSADTIRPGSHMSCDVDGEHRDGMRRTPSGMFMPFDETNDDAENLAQAGVFGRVIDTVNTARDIAHVIWNVGWRK